MFTRIVAENFLSWECLDFTFNAGVTLVEGFNRDDGSSEGSGKSAIPNALAWGLYGCIPKEVNIDEVIREGTDSCIVTIYTNDNIQIVRKRGPNELFIVGKDGQKIKGKDVKETQKLVQDLIGMSFDTFCQSIYFAQNYGKKFITASEEDKAKIFSELQDLSWCDKAAKVASEQLKHTKACIDKLTGQTSKIEAGLHVYKANIINYKELNARFEAEKANEIQALQIRLRANQDTISNLQTSLLDLGKEVDIKIQKEEVSALNVKIIQNQDKVNQYLLHKMTHEKALKMKDCPTCGQALKDAKEIPPMPVEPKEAKALVESLKKDLLAAMAAIDSDNQKVSQRKELTIKITMLQAMQKTGEEDLLKLEKKTNLYATQIEQTNANIKLMEKDLLEYEVKLQSDYEKAQSLEALKSGFKELKSHVFHSLISELNAKSNKYIQELFEVPASIHFSNYSAEGEISKITTAVVIDGNERSIGLLSGGQFRRVQIAVDFALSEIVSERGSNPVNLRILDEPFKDLSTVSMTKVIELMEHMSGSTVIIEHNDIVRSIVNNVFKVELKDRVSKQV